VTGADGSICALTNIETHQPGTGRFSPAGQASL